MWVFSTGIGLHHLRLRTLSQAIRAPTKYKGRHNLRAFLSADHNPLLPSPSHRLDQADWRRRNCNMRATIVMTLTVTSFTSIHPALHKRMFLLRFMNNMASKFSTRGIICQTVRIIGSIATEIDGSNSWCFLTWKTCSKIQIHDCVREIKTMAINFYVHPQDRFHCLVFVQFQRGSDFSLVLLPFPVRYSPTGFIKGSWTSIEFYNPWSRHQLR